MGNTNQSSQSDQPDPSGRKYLPPLSGPIEKRTPWPHAPTHMLSAAGTYFVTAGTYLKRHHFRAPERRSVLQLGLMTVARDFGWAIEAWAILANHYHFVAHSPAEGGARNLSQMLGVLHKKTALWVNRIDGEPGRKVWHNFRETRLTYPKSYFARLNYTHQNPVKHGLVPVANQYPWCSAGWLEQTAPPSQVKTIYSFVIEHVKVYDDFGVEPET